MYPPLTGAPHPKAVLLCEALHKKTQTKRTECCQTKSGDLTSECVRMLSYALTSNALTLPDDELNRCTSALDKRFEDCKWLNPGHGATAVECESVLHGQLPPGALCRSSLECTGTSVCLGLGPTAPGKCGPKKSDGMACDLGTDTLRVYTLQDEKTHAECEGVCGRRRCQPLVKAGDTCLSAMQCPEGLACVDRKCVTKVLPKANQPCDGTACAPDARCIKGTCRTPKPAGAPCETLFECEAACKIPKGQKSGVCGDVCPP